MKNRCDEPIIMVLERKHIISFRWIYIDVHYCAATRIVIRHFDWTMKYFARITTVKYLCMLSTYIAMRFEIGKFPVLLSCRCINTWTTFFQNLVVVTMDDLLKQARSV